MGIAAAAPRPARSGARDGCGPARSPENAYTPRMGSAAVTAVRERRVWRVEGLTLIGFGIALALLLAIGVVAYRGIVAARRGRR